MKLKSEHSKQIIEGLPLSVEGMNKSATQIVCITPIISTGQVLSIRDVSNLIKKFKQTLYSNLIAQEVFRSDIYLIDVDVSVDTFNALGRAYLKLYVTLYGNGEIDGVITNPIKELIGLSWCKFKVLDEV